MLQQSLLYMSHTIKLAYLWAPNAPVGPRPNVPEAVPAPAAALPLQQHARQGAVQQDVRPRGNGRTGNHVPALASAVLHSERTLLLLLLLQSRHGLLLLLLVGVQLLFLLVLQSTRHCLPLLPLLLLLLFSIPDPCCMCPRLDQPLQSFKLRPCRWLQNACQGRAAIAAMKRRCCGLGTTPRCTACHTYCRRQQQW